MGKRSSDLLFCMKQLPATHANEIKSYDWFDLTYELHVLTFRNTELPLI